MSAVEAVDGVSAITPDRLRNLVRACDRVAGIPGDAAELGVFRGGSARVLASMFPEKTLHLFDTFSGLPFDETPEDDPNEFVRKGMFACGIRDVEDYLRGCNVDCHPGIFPESTLGLNAFRFCLVHIDCDLGKTARDAIKWFWPRMNPGGIMYFDDYGCKFTGVTNAVDNVFARERIEKQYDMYKNQIGALVVKI